MDNPETVRLPARMTSPAVAQGVTTPAAKSVDILRASRAAQHKVPRATHRLRTGARDAGPRVGQGAAVAAPGADPPERAMGRPETVTVVATELTLMTPTPRSEATAPSGGTVTAAGAAVDGQGRHPRPRASTPQPWLTFLQLITEDEPRTTVPAEAVA